MAAIGIFRSQTSQMPGTAKPFSDMVTRRGMSTATKPIMENKNNPVVNISGFTTLRGKARQGTTPAVGGLRTIGQGSSGSSMRRGTRGLIR